jgi:hypothetical protein
MMAGAGWRVRPARKPTIPESGEDGIRIRDEIVLERTLE